ncbi:hypothetical protein F2P81_020770 [Scophthalmus maximus]|uniref:Uncharacterized protein n=1 Tax=Scophthalmus maximus TaxID=52904 RepID=A0A6A4RVI3_SCOMX|nr:hypothetical protein F2P81_020770 [Scophthalmus maximus]
MKRKRGRGGLPSAPERSTHQHRSFMRISLASALAALFAASLASACGRVENRKRRESETGVDLVRLQLPDGTLLFWMSRVCSCSQSTLLPPQTGGNKKQVSSQPHPHSKTCVLPRPFTAKQSHDHSEGTNSWQEVDPKDLEQHAQSKTEVQETVVKCEVALSETSSSGDFMVLDMNIETLVEYQQPPAVDTKPPGGEGVLGVTCRGTSAHLSGDEVQGIVLRRRPLLLGGPLPSRALSPHVGPSEQPRSSASSCGSSRWTTTTTTTSRSPLAARRVINPKRRAALTRRGERDESNGQEREEPAAEPASLSHIRFHTPSSCVAESQHLSHVRPPLTPAARPVRSGPVRSEPLFPPDTVRTPTGSERGEATPTGAARRVERVRGACSCPWSVFVSVERVRVRVRGACSCPWSVFVSVERVRVRVRGACSWRVSVERRAADPLPVTRTSKCALRRAAFTCCRTSQRPRPDPNCYSDIPLPVSFMYSMYSNSCTCIRHATTFCARTK